MATQPAKNLVSARRSGGEYEASNVDRWYQSIEKEANNGIASYAFNSVSGDHTLDVTDSLALVDASSTSVIITLPTAVGIQGRRYDIKKIDSSSNTVVVQPNGSETIDGCNPMTISKQYTNMTIVSDGSNWWII